MRAPMLIAAICLFSLGTLGAPLEPNEPQASRAPTPIEGQRPDKPSHGIFSRSAAHLGNFLDLPPSWVTSIFKGTPVALTTPQDSKPPSPFEAYTIEEMVKKVAEQVYEERETHPEISGQPEEKPLLELYGALYMRAAMEKERDALRDTNKIDRYQAELKESMEKMTHADLKDLAEKYRNLHATESKGQQATRLQDVVKRASLGDHHHDKHHGKKHHDQKHHDQKHHDQKTHEKDRHIFKVPKPVVKRADPFDEIDFTIGITLGGEALLPSRRPLPTASRPCTNCPKRPTPYSTVVSFPTTLSVPLDIDDLGHVSVIGNKGSKKPSVYRPAPTRKPTGKHHSGPAPSFIPVLISDHGHLSTAFIAVPPPPPMTKSTHKHYSTLAPIVIGPTVPTRTPDYRLTRRLPTGTPSAISLPPSCVPLPSSGNLPRPAVNDAKAFVGFPLYSEISKFHAKVPGYKAAFINRRSRTESARHLLKTYPLRRYDPLACAAICSHTAKCKGFNVFIQRDPAARLSPSCPNPPHQASAHCAMFSVGVSSLGRGVAENFVSKQRFQRVYAASNGYDQLPAYAGWTGPAAVNGVYKPTSDTLLGQGRGQLLYKQTFRGEIDPAVCINQCDRINAVDRGVAFQNHKFDVKNDTEHGIKGRYRPCNFFNIFQTTPLGPATGPLNFTCSFWTSAPNAPIPNLVQTVGGEKVESSFWYNRRRDDLGRYHQEDLIETGPHDPSIEDRAARQTPTPRPVERVGI